MTQQELVLDYAYYEEGKCNFDDLKAAAENLTAVTEEQFEVIKNEKWFTRVFDMVTFSKKNEKRIANQIENVAQAQQVMMEILVRMSDRDTKIAELVNQSFNRIEKLSENDILLAKRIHELEKRCVLGISKDTDIEDLSETEREILGGLFFDLGQKFVVTSEEQQRYAHNVLNYLGVETQEINISASLDKMNNIDKKMKLLTCCFEYGFLYQYRFDFPEEVEEIIDMFDFGNKSIRKIKNQISSVYRIRGAAGIVDRYGHYDEIEEEFYVDISVSETEVEKEVTELEEITINNILHIAKDEKTVFKNKKIHIRAYIDCKGSLVFENCTIYYNESETSDEITLTEGADIQFNNCTVICKGMDDIPFIQGEGNNKFILNNSIFQDCAYFIKSGYSSKIFLDGCRLENPYVNFIESFSLTEGSVTNLYIHFSNIAEFYFENERSYNHPIMKLSDSVSIRECIIFAEDDFINKSSGIVQVFDGDELEFKNCNFVNVHNCIQYSKSVSINECIFENCSKIIQSYNMKVEGFISNCVFDNCQSIVEGGILEQRLLIKNTQFVSCQNQLIKGNGIHLQFCEFDNLKNSTEYNSGFFILEFTGGKDSPVNKIEKCIFDGIDVDKGFLIGGKYHEKIKSPKVIIEDCNFRNCRSNRDSGKIIKEYDTYLNTFKKEREHKPVEIRNCKGLDKVNKENGFTEDVIIKAETPKGNKIGSIVATVRFGVPGYLVSKTVGKAMTDDDLHSE